MKTKAFLTVCLVLLVTPNVLAKNILIIESYHSEYPWDASYLAGIREMIGDKHKIQTFQMNTKRIPSDQYSRKAEEAWDAYLKIRPDLVILGDDNALKFLGPKLIKTDTPVVYLGINCNPRNYINVRKSNCTGVLERPLLKRSIVSIRQIFNIPLKKILVLFDSERHRAFRFQIILINKHHSKFWGSSLI